MELSLSWIWGALATTTARAGNGNVPSFRVYFRQISENGKYRWTWVSLEDRTQVRTQEIEFVPVFTSPKKRHKRKFTVVFVQVVKKSALDKQNLLFFHWLIGLIAVAVTVSFVVAPRIYRCASTVRNPNKVSVKTAAIFSLDIQGVPKVRSSNFMHYNFWSKLYFYMKFLEDVYFSIKYMCSEFQ